MQLEFIKKGMLVTPKACLVTSDALIDGTFYPKRIVVPGEVLKVVGLNRKSFFRPVALKTAKGEPTSAYFSEIKPAGVQ